MANQFNHYGLTTMIYPLFAMVYSPLFTTSATTINPYYPPLNPTNPYSRVYSPLLATTDAITSITLW